MSWVDIDLKMQYTHRLLSRTTTAAAGYLSKVLPSELAYAGQTARTSGFIDGPGQQVQHKVYWAEYGNPNGEPVLFVHGGPGGGTSPSNTGYFNPQRYRVILFDQRGCGKSTPSVSDDATALEALKDNTTPQLIEDMTRLLKELNIRGKVHVFGGSWGSTLSLAFAIAHPELVATLILRGIFLVRKKDLDYFYQGNAEVFHLDPYESILSGAYLNYPEAWKPFVEQIPVEKRHDMVQAYYEIFNQPAATEEIAKRQHDAAVTWSVWEGITSVVSQDMSSLERFADPVFAKAFAKIENHYFMHGGFLGGVSRTQNYLCENASKIAHLPIHIVQGRYDAVCPRFGADELVQALRIAGATDATLDYRVVPAGHSALEREVARELTDIMEHLPRL